jgi:hypothetical protein
MYRIASLAALVVIALFSIQPARAQFEPDRDQIKTTPYDTTKQVAADSAESDSATADSTKTKVTAPTGRTGEEEGGNVNLTDAAVAAANKWVRRILYRGSFDATHIGAYAQYQLTSWDEAVGSFGPVEGKLAVYYLGTSEWMGKDAEWLQLVYQSVDAEPTMVYYDLLVPSASSVKQIYRALYRVDDGQLKTANFAFPADQLDYDAADKPSEDGVETVRLYSGMYETEKSRGAGAEGSVVVIYASKDVPPLGIVRLGYGDACMTLISKGLDAAPRFDVPAPPSAAGSTGQ